MHVGATRFHVGNLVISVPVRRQRHAADLALAVSRQVQGIPQSSAAEESRRLHAGAYTDLAAA